MPFPFGYRMPTSITDKEKEEDPFTALLRAQAMDEPEEDIPYSFEREEPRTERYLNYLREQPVQQEFDVSTGRRLLSSLVGALAGRETGLAVRDANFRNALQEWKQRGAGLQEGAEFEQKGLTEGRKLFSEYQKTRRAKDRLATRQQEIFDRHQRELKRLEFITDSTARRQAEIELNGETLRELAAMRAETGRMEAITSQGRLAAAQKAEERLAEIAGRIPPLEQKRARELAKTVVARDPRFSEFWDNEAKGFGDILKLDREGNPMIDEDGNEVIEKEMDPATREAIMTALAQAEKEILAKTRKIYFSEE